MGNETFYWDGLTTKFKLTKRSMFTTGKLITKTVQRKQYKYYKQIIYISSGHPSGCFNLAPDLRKSTMSMPPRPEYGVLPYRNKQPKQTSSFDNKCATKELFRVAYLGLLHSGKC